MSIRLKLSIFLLVFILIASMFGGGTMFIFDRISNNLDLLKKTSEEYRLHEELKMSIVEFSTYVKSWAFTGEQRYRRLYRDGLSKVYQDFGALQDYVADKDVLKEVGSKFTELNRTARKIFSYSRPKGNQAVLHLVGQIEEQELDILTSVEELHTESLKNVTIAVKETEESKARLTLYVAVLIFITIFSVIFLVLLITRSIGRPFKELLLFTEKIISGEVDAMTGVERNDEFGIIARRFGQVLSKLKESEENLRKRLSETELLFEVTRIASSTLELKESLKLITETVADWKGLDYVGVYLLNVEGQVFTLQALNRDADIFERSFAVDSGELCRKILDTREPVYKEMPTEREVAFIKRSLGSLILFPIIREGRCLGLFFIGVEAVRKFTENELNIANILSNTIGTIVRNAELYVSAMDQLNKITVLYELSRDLTTLLDLEDLLKRVVFEVTRLLHAKGCIIRLQEDHALKIKAHYGVPVDFIKGMETEVGEGIAGKVSSSGKSMLVENVAEMPEDTRVPVLEAKSVVCVPLKIGNEVIGTIGLYDKKGPEGEIITFNLDDLRTTEGIASLISLAIEKARIFEKEKEKEQEALEAKKRLDILFESVQGGIVTLDRNYTLLSINRFVEEFLHMQSEDVVGRSALEIFHEKGGICPHCAAKLTFETGDINIITQSKGANYAELSSYPIKDEEGDVVEAVVLIQDITDRVLYQEEILALYKEVAQTKEYLESLIDNSADAIVTTDLKGVVTSWNRGAERIYGFTEEEAIGSFLPFIPDFLLETEMQYIERIKQGETIKNIETLRKKRDGAMIEVSLTLSPIKDASGEVIGISGISRDISEKKKVEKELIRRNQELSRLFFISSAMRGTLELERLLRMVLTAVTMSDGLGFNRAILFLLDEEKSVLRGTMGVGPATPEEAWQIWERLSIEKKSLPEILRDIEEGPLRKDSFLDRLSTGIEVDLKDDTALSRAVRERKSFNIHDVKHDDLADPAVIQLLGTEAYAVVPLIARNKVIGVLWVDNYFNRKPITDEDMRFLSGFSDQIASAIESARLFEKVKLAESELENIFESISDLLYITTEDYTIRNINRAVVEKIGRKKEEIVGRKCYEIFHGMDRPYEKCPHHKTVKTQKAYIEELEDTYRGGTFLTSTSPLFDSSSNFMGTVHIVRDISELKKLREKLAMAEKMAALGEVAAKVAHEIRNPLVSIGGFSRRLEKRLDGKLLEYASVITREVDRLEEILKEILSFVRDVRISKEHLEGVKIIEDILSLFSQEIKKRGVVLETDFKDPLSLEVDPNRIKEALINIINNAIQIMGEGDHLIIRTYREQDYGVIEVSDTGPGINGKDLPYIFDPFFTTKIDGTGLGLAIAHRIIEEHQGKIDVYSTPGEGTTFKIYLPYKN
ncbi:MAG: PAS domain S-box protein [Nitrospirota bacterium]|nr:PAS domain S-box protein [Nitrospirota bacterium]